MTADEPNPGLFWLALSLVALVLLWVIAKLLFGSPKPPKPTLWVCGLAALMPACSVVPVVPDLKPASGSGWSTPHMPIDHFPPTGRDLLQRT